jgi:hypothetical protein
MMGWAEGFDIRGLERRIEVQSEIIAELAAKLAALEAAIAEFNVVNVTPAGAYVPRNHRRFGV